MLDSENSLSEDPNVLVGVIEAGEIVKDMPQINIPGSTFNSHSLYCRSQPFP